VGEEPAEPGSGVPAGKFGHRGGDLGVGGEQLGRWIPQQQRRDLPRATFAHRHDPARTTGVYLYLS